MKIDLAWNIGDIISTVVALFALIAAVCIGVKQNQINRHMLNLQRFVDLYLVCSKQPAKKENGEVFDADIIEIHNISSQPVALIGYVFNGCEREMSPYRLPPASQHPGAHYYIYLPYDKIDYVSFSIYIQDAFLQKWIVRGFAEIKHGKWEVSTEYPKRIDV